MVLAAWADGLTIGTTSPLPVARVGRSYSCALAASGGGQSYTWEIVSGALPEGLALSAEGAITGTPTKMQGATFTVIVRDDSGASDSRQFTMTVNPGGTTLSNFRISGNVRIQ